MPERDEIEADVKRLREIEIESRKLERAHIKSRALSRAHSRIAHEAGLLADKIAQLVRRS